VSIVNALASDFEGRSYLV